MPVRPRVAAPPVVPVPRRRFLARALGFFAAGALLERVRPARAATGAAEPFIGEIMLFAGNFAPRGWAFCNGQLLAIAQNTALFSLLGTTYGGNGQTTFALPDLRGRAPIHWGQGPGLSNYFLGQNGGTEYHSLIQTEMPAHSHALLADAGNGTSATPAGMTLANDPAGVPQYGATPTTPMAAGAVAAAGGSQPHNNLPPHLAISYCIALEGIYPSQS